MQMADLSDMTEAEEDTWALRNMFLVAQDRTKLSVALCATDSLSDFSTSFSSSINPHTRSLKGLSQMKHAASDPSALTGPPVSNPCPVERVQLRLAVGSKMHRAKAGSNEGLY